MNRRRSDRSGRVFILLIFVMLGLLALQRVYPELSRLFNLQVGSTPVVQVENTPSPTALIEEEAYPFLPPTVMPATPEISPTPVYTPTPLAPLAAVDITPYVLGDVSIEATPRATPIGNIGGIIGRCDLPYKQYQYFFYDLSSKQYRPLTSVFNYLEKPESTLEQAYLDGRMQQGMDVEQAAMFPLPQSWLQDQRYAVLGIDQDDQSLLIHRYQGTDGGIYWLAQGADSPLLLLSSDGALEESVEVPEMNSVLFQIADSEAVQQLYLVDLLSGELRWLTAYQDDSARNGRISPNQRWLTYWTGDGVWQVSLDGSYASLRYPGGAYPEWSPDSGRLAMTQNEYVMVSNFEGTAMEALYSSDGKRLIGSRPQWAPDGKRLIYWQQTGSACLWKEFDILSKTERTLYQLDGGKCNPQARFSFSADGFWMMGTIGSASGSGFLGGDVICPLTGTDGCRVLQSQWGYGCWQSAWVEEVPAFVWTFDESDDGWYVVQQLQNLIITDSQWSAVSSGDFPVLSSPANLGIDADVFSWLEITMSIDRGASAMIYIATDAERQYNDLNSFRFPVIDDGEFHRYRISLSEWEQWQGLIYRFRLRPTDADGAVIRIDQIQFFAD